MIDIIYRVQTLLKVLFIPMALFSLPYTFLLAISISLIGALRNLKLPKFTKQYLFQLLTNNHGQSLLYLLMCGLGYTNYLFYSPLTLYFLYAIVEYINLKHHGTRFQPYIERIKNVKFYIMEGRAKLEISFFVFMLLTLPMDFMMRLLKVFLIAQYLLLRFRISKENQTAFASINSMVGGLLNHVPILGNIYHKIVNIVYSYATKS